MHELIRKLTTAVHAIRRWSLRRKLTALGLTITVAAASIVVPLIAGTLAGPSLVPGTQAYYDARWEEAKVKAGYLTADEIVTALNNPAITATDVTEGPWALNLQLTDPTCSAPWDGNPAGDPMTDADTVTGAAYDPVSNPYKVSTAEQFRWAMVNRYSYTLQNDIDLAGYKGAGNIWTNIVTAPPAAIIANGNGHTVYNYFYTGAAGTSLFGSTLSNANAGLPDSKITDLRLSNSYAADLTGSGTESGLFAYTCICPILHCAIENSLISAATVPAGSIGIYIAPFNSTKTLDNCYCRNVHVYNRGLGDGTGDAHATGFVMMINNQVDTYTNCFAVDGTVISNGGHSGGFISCGTVNAGYPVTVTNCFTNALVYGNKNCGGFYGMEGLATGTINVTSCYSSGMVEGVRVLGGFAACTVNGTAGFFNAKNCYSTAMVGMNGGGWNLGGFLAGKSVDSNGQPQVTQHTITTTNCYAAGEVGSLDTDVTLNRTANKDVGGFVGGSGTADQTVTNMFYVNCYYDKQTTAMREWAAGAYLSADDSSLLGSAPGALGVLPRVTGLLTTDTAKSIVGLAGTSPKPGLTAADGWVLTADHYPQLAVFADPTTIEKNFNNINWMTQIQLTNLVKAYSEASTATAECHTYDNDYLGNPLPATTYDTVRDLTLKVPMTPAAGTVWQKAAMSGIPAAPTVSLYGQTVYVCDLLQNGGQYTAANFAPGIQWLNVQVTEGDQVGQRYMRLVPTANLSPGKEAYVKVGSAYNHAQDAWLSYSTAPRMNVNMNDITQGVYPDDPLTTVQQQAIQNPLADPYLSAFNAGNNQYFGVDVNHMSLNQLSDPNNDGTDEYPAVHGTAIPSNATDGKMYVVGTTGVVAGDGTDLLLDNSGSANLWNDKFNGLVPFTNADIGNYTLQYTWVLKDGRYLQGGKIIHVGGIQGGLPASELKFTGYDMGNTINGNSTDASCADTSPNKFTGAAFISGSGVWMTPGNADMVVLVDPITGQMTGYKLPDVGATANRYAGQATYLGGNLWFAPGDATAVLEVNPGNGSITTYSLSDNAVGVPDPTALGKYCGCVSDGSSLWLIPYNSDSLVKVNPQTGAMTGYPLSAMVDPAGASLAGDASTTTGTAKFRGAVYDGTNLWLIPYNADKVVEVSGLGSTALTITGFDISGTDLDGDASATTADGKYGGAAIVSDGPNMVIWMAPAGSDKVLKLSGLGNPIPTMAGIDLAAGANINMGPASTGTGADKFSDAIFDGKSLWLIPSGADRVVSIDPATGLMTALTIPLYKSMMAGDKDAPYVNAPDPADNYHNYYNNNNWGMTGASSSGTAMYTGGCFDGYNLWMSPDTSDRVTKISPSVDETVSVSANGRTVTADLANYMSQVNPNTGAVPTIDKIEWVRVDNSKADTPNLSYKGNTQSPYTDVKATDEHGIGIPTNSTADYFDHTFAQASVADKGTVYASMSGSQAAQTLMFEAPTNGTYYIRAYFTDPVNGYGMDAAYNAERGTPQMVTVIKEVTIGLTGTVYIRQIVTGTLPTGFDAPDSGYMQMKNTADSATAGIVTPSGTSASTTFAPFTLPVNNQFALTDIVPQYFTYAGYTITPTGDDPKQTTTPDKTDAQPVAFDTSATRYITVYITPNTDTPANNENPAADNTFAKTFGAVLTDDFQNFPTPPNFGDTIAKAVGAKNTNAANAYVRILLQPTITSADGTALPATIGTDSGDTLIIEDPGTDWMDGGDGYWYYTLPLRPGQSVADNLFTKLTLNSKLGGEYKSAALTIEVVCEAAGTNPDFYRMYFWGGTDPITDTLSPLYPIDQALSKP